MSLAIDWRDESQQTLYCIMRGNISSNDLRAILNICHREVQSVTHRVDMLFSVDNVSRMPGTFLSILATFINQVPENFGVIVLMGENTYISSLVMSFWQIYPYESKRIHLAASVEEAIGIIETEREQTT